MQAFLNSTKGVSSSIVLLLVAFVVFVIYLSPATPVHYLLVALLFMMINVAVYGGVLVGLVVSLLLLFVVGTVLLVASIQNPSIGGLQLLTLSIEQFVWFGGALVVCVLLAGSIHERIRQVFVERDRLRSEMEQFVAIDPVTSFDNWKRMRIEIEREMARVKRHGGHFMLVLLELDHYKEFRQVYGEKEVAHLLQSIGKKMNDALRHSDRKFRYNENRFALLLTETTKEHIETVLEKLAGHLETHQLANGKTVTLTYHMSFNEYNMEQQQSYEQFIEQLESDIPFYAL